MINKLLRKKDVYGSHSCLTFELKRLENRLPGKIYLPNYLLQNHKFHKAEIKFSRRFLSGKNIGTN